MAGNQHTKKNEQKAPDTGNDEQQPNTNADGKPSLYEGGKEDERQAEQITPTLFRPKFRRLNETELRINDALKEKANELHTVIAGIDCDATPAAREYKARAEEALELAVMWAVKGLTA